MPRRPDRRCLSCGRYKFDPRAGACRGCGATPEQRRDYSHRPSSAARGYDKLHRRNRKVLQVQHPHGPCAVCGGRGTWRTDAPPAQRLTAGHIDHDAPSTLDNLRPEHLSCNSGRRRSAGAKPGTAHHPD